MIPLDPAGLEAAARQLAENERLAPNGERARDSAAEVVRAYLAAAGRAAATPDPPDDEGWSPGVDDPEPPALGDIDTGEGWYQT